MPPKTLTPSYDSTQGANLNTNLNSEFENSGQYTGILDRYNQAQGATSANTQATGQYIANQYGGDVSYQKLQNHVQQDSYLEGREGFATNVAALTNLQAQGAQRVKQLTDQANNALMANNSAGAKALSDLAVQEQTALTTARTNFLNNYFTSQTEARSQASFRTPEQTATISLAQQYPGAGIAEGDTLAQAQAKITSSPLYQANLGKVYQDIQSAQAQAKAQLTEAGAAVTSANASATSAAAGANLSNAQAAQTKFLTSLYQGGSTGAQNTDVQALLTGGATPQSLQAKYANVPNGGLLVSNILSQAQSQGYNLNTGTLSGLAQQKQTETLNSGSLFNSIGLRLNNLFNTGAQTLYNATDVGGSAPGNSYLHPTTGQSQNLGGQTYKFDGKNWVKQ